MAFECYRMMGAANLLKGELIESSTIKQLGDAIEHLPHVALFLSDLEKVHPENGISAQLGALFIEACNGFSEICSRMNDQGLTSDTSRILKVIKLKNVADHLKSSNTSRSTSQMISEVLKIIKLENIAHRIKDSKPSRSSSRITMEMVWFLEALLDFTMSFLHRVHSSVHQRRTAVFKKKLRFLRVFFKLSAKRCIEHESMKDFFTYVEDVAYAAAHLCFLGLTHNMDSEISEFLERTSISFRPELRQIYMSVLIGSKSSRSETTMNAENMLDFVSALEEGLEELLACGYRIPWLQQGLSFFSGFLQDIELKRFPPEEFNFLQSHIEALAIEAAVVIYSYDKEMDKTTEINHVFSHLQLKFNHLILEVDLIKLLNSQATIVVPLKDLIGFVREELVFLRNFIMDSLDRCKEQTKIADFLTLIQSVTSQAWSVISSLNLAKKKLAGEINCWHFQLLLKFKFIKAVIRQMCPSSASSTPDHPSINLLNFLPINFEVLDSYFSMLKSSKTISSNTPKLSEVSKGFHEYILGNLLLKGETSLTFTVANEVKKFYYGLLLLVPFLVDPFHCIGCEKQNLSTGFGTIAIEAESALSYFGEDAVDSDKYRKVNLVLLFLNVAFWFVESEGILLDLLKHKATMKAQILDLFESAHEELIFLRAILIDLLRQHTELNGLHDLLMHAGVTAHKLAQIGVSFYENSVNGSNSEKMRLSLFDFLQEIEFVKVEVRKVCFQVVDASPCKMSKTDGEDFINFLLTQQDKEPEYDAGLISFLNNQISVVKDKLLQVGSLLSDIVQYRNMHLELRDLAEDVQEKKYVCFFSVRGYRPAWYYTLYLSDVKQLLKFVNAEVKMICLKVPDSSSFSFPTTNGLGFLNYFFYKLEELLHSKLDSVIKLKNQIGLVKEGLLRLRSLVDDFAGSHDEHDEVCGLISSITVMAYKAEYVIDSCLACSHPFWYKVLWISEVVENIKLVNKDVSETFKRTKIEATVHEGAKTSTYLAPFLSDITPRAIEEIEGFQDTMDELKEKLLGGSPQLDVISIVGMPGLGKTTLAKKIYNDPTISSHFDVHAQCLVTQLYSWRELLLTILSDVLEPADRNEKEDSELADELRRFLLTKRFLILIDDVWDNKVWDYLYMCFKDVRNGSRIILTTRLTDVANYVKCESDPHHLRLFRDDESWTLLKQQVFQGESCPPELGDVGFRIAKTCRGLPLSIVLVAGVLKQKKKKPDVWKVVEQSLGSQSIGSLKESMSIIEFSYKNLPHYLKPCFLYLGGFLKGKDIRVSKLTQLWQAEGFVQADNEADGAQDFLENLLRRNLVMGMEKRPNGKVKTCSIHDLLHTFCLEKAKQENFLLQINSGEDVFPGNPKGYRLFVHSYQDEIDFWRPSRSNVRSLLFNAIDPDNLLWPRDISFIFDSFKLVKVLDLESFNIGGTFPSKIQYLVQLRYFAVQTDANLIPSSIAKLWNLETFVVRGLGGEMILPSSLMKMVKLRHMHIKHRVSFASHENMDESLANSQLANLITFSTPLLSYGEDAEKILRKMPNLRKLGCIFSGTFGYSEKVGGRCVLFPRLEYLIHLESLKLVSNSYPAKLPHEFNFPSQLRELTLLKFRLPWPQISTIAELPNLEILKLSLRAFEGDYWEVKDSEFPELKYLKLDNLKVAQWSVPDGAFPKLEHLVLTKCKQLEKIPSHFEDAISLKSIEINWCSWSVANSAQEIQTTQREDMANDAFRVTIQPPDWARRSSP